MMRRQPSLPVRMPTESVPSSRADQAKAADQACLPGVTPRSWNLRIVGALEP